MYGVPVLKSIVELKNQLIEGIFEFPIQAFIIILPLLGMHLTQKNLLNHMLMMNK